MNDFLFFDPFNGCSCLPSCDHEEGGRELSPIIARTLEETAAALREESPQAILFRGPPGDLPGIVTALKALSPQSPLIFLFEGSQGPLVEEILQQGVHACICSENLTWQRLQRCLLHAEKLGRLLLRAPVLESELAETRLDVESHRKAYRRISDDLRAAVKALASMGEFNRLFFHATDEVTTIRNFCRVLVKGHGYRMAWAGTPRQTPQGLQLLPISHAGDEQGFLSTPFICEERLLPVLEDHPWVIHDIRHESEGFPWRDRALERNYRSMAALPFRGLHDDSVGILCVFGKHGNTFSTDRLAMLVDMARMLSGGLRILNEKIRQEMNKSTIELMDLAVRTAVSGFVIFSIEKGIQFLNDAALALSGYSSSEEVLGHPYRDFVQVNEKTPEVLQTVLGGGNWTGEFDLIRKDGTLREVFSSVSAIRNEGQSVLSVLVSFIDLSEKKKTEQDLHKSRALYEAIIEDQTDMILRFLPENLEITYANLPYARYYETTPEDLLGQTFSSHYTPDQEACVREHLRGLTPESPTRTIEEQVIAPGGKTRWQQWIDRGIFDASGRLVEVQGVGRDITEIKAAHEELRRQKVRLETFFENSPDGIVFCTTDQRIELANPAFYSLFGYATGEVTGRRIDSILAVPPQERNAALELNLTGEDGLVRSFEGNIAGKDGIPAFVSATVFPCSEEDGTISGTYFIYRDLTERRQKEEALRISNTIIEGSPAVVFRWQAKPGWPVEYVSENIRQFGYTPEELTRPGFVYTSIMHPDDVPRVENEVTVFDRDKCESFNHQYRIFLKNGEIRWVAERNRPERDAEGRLMHHFGVLIDDTERRRAEIEARENHCALQRSLEQLEVSFRKTIEVLSSATEARDPYTAGHQRKVAQLSEAIGLKMGLPEKTCEGIYLAAMVHDVGKISIPAELLSKPAKLNPVEMALIQTHPESAYEILRNVDTPWNLAEIVRQHHERLDGSGYPQGLRGDEILLEARIIAVADVFEAMASDRPYRAGLGMEAALAALEAGEGTTYDPLVVETCRRLLMEGFAFDSESRRYAFAPGREDNPHAS